MMNESKDKNVKANTDGNATKLNAKFKETWTKLTNADLALYPEKRDQFMGKLKELYSLSSEDADKKIEAIEVQCGCSSTSATKAA